MGIEPTQDGNSALLTVLKPRSPPGLYHLRRVDNAPDWAYNTLLTAGLEEAGPHDLVKKILIPVIIDSRFL